MQKIKSLLALVAALVCGGAWAADRVDTVWNGDFVTLDSSGGKVTHLSKIIDGVTYTLELNGNRVVWDETTQSSYIEITNTSGELGAVVTRSTGTGASKGGTIFMKYSGLSSNSNPPNGIIASMYQTIKGEAVYNNITGLKVGSVADGSVTLNGFWAEGYGAYASRGNDASGTSGTIPAGDDVTTIAVSYGGSGETVFVRNDSESTWTKVYNNNGAGRDTYDITRFGFGGFCSTLTRTGDLKTNARPATGLKIHSIAILCSAPTGATDANLTGFSFPAVSTATTDMVYMSHLDGNATNQGSDSTVTPHDLNTVGWYGSGKFGNNAVKANGGSYIVRREDNSAFAMFSTGWTASFWVNTSTSGDWKDVGAIKLGSVYYHFERQTGNNFAIYNSGSLGGGANVIDMNTAGTWAHIAMIAWPQADDASTLKVDVYLNGTKAGTISHANLCGTDGPRGVTRFVIGGDGVENDDTGTTRRGNGGIDEVAIYNYAVGPDMLSFLAANAPVATLDGVKTAKTGGAVNFSAITWSNDSEWLASTEALLTLTGDTTLTVDSPVTMGSLTISGSGNLTIKHAENLTYSSFATPALASVTYEVDATQTNFTANDALKNYIKNAGNLQKFVFLGADGNGATIDYGTVEANRWNKSVATHLVFDGGTHVLGIDNENSGLKFGANATAENPTILVKGERAVLTFKTRNPCGWSSGAPTTAGIIRVNDGATLNFNQSSGTMYWGQQFYLEPGATLNSTENSDNFRINGGASRTAPQIYVPASTAGNTKVARITKSSGIIQSNNQANKGFTVFVGANSKLSFESQVTKSDAESAIVKIGTGILEFTKSVDAPVKVLQGQVAFSGEGTVSNTLTMGYDGTIGFPEGTNEGESYTIPCTTLVAESIYRRFSVGRTTNYGAIVYNTTDKTATYYMDKPRALAINFNSDQGKEGDTAVSAALGVETVGAVWTNVTDANKDPAIDIAVYDTSKSATSTANAQVKWGSSTNYQRGSEPVSFLKGYLDDGNHNSISGPTVEFTNIPFTKYSVVIYSWGDGSASRPFSLTNAALGESAVSYTANAMNETVTGSDNWGIRTGNLAYGVNALRVDGLTGETLTIQGGGKSGDNRGVLSAVMIIEAPNYNTWIGAENASWDEDSNWSANVVPTATDSVCLPSGATIAVSATSAVGTLLGGDATLVFTGSVAQPSASMATALTSASWTGTVKLQDIQSSSTARLYLEKFGNANSKVVVSGVSGWWIEKTTFNFELEVVNNASNVGFTITDGGSTGSSTFKKLSGSGVLKGAGGSNQGYVINDASEFTGTIDAATKCFSFGTTSRWGQNIIVVDANNEVTVSKNWQATSGMTINGTVHLTSSGSIPSVSGSGTVSCEGKVPNNDGLTQTGWTGTVLISETISTGSTKFGNAGSTLEVAAGKTLTLTAATSIDSRVLLGDGAKIVFSKANTEEFTVNAETLHDLSALANIEVPDGAKLVYVVQATAEELGKGTTTVIGVPDGAVVRVGSTTSEPSTDETVTINTGVKIDGNATIFDITFKNNKGDIGKAGGGGGHFDYNINGSGDLKWDTAASFTKTADEEWDDSVGCYIKHHPYIDGAKSIFSSLTDFTTVVVGTMSPTANTQFIHFGSCADGRSGLFLATTGEKDKVLVASNAGATVKEITTLTVPNAATARHVYVITKHDTETESIFTVYLDGVRRAIVPLGSKISLGNSAHSGVQVGSSFGGALNSGTYKAVANNDDETGAINVLRVYNYIISGDQITALTTKYPYESEGGLYMRTIDRDTTFSAANAWSLSGVMPAVTEDIPTRVTEGYEPSFELEATKDATVTVNASANIEVATFNGSKMIFAKSGENKLMITDSLLVNNQVKIEYGAIDISGALVSLRDEKCTLEIDMSNFSVNEIYTTTLIPLTGEARETDNVTVTLPTPPVGVAVEAVFEANRYQLKVTPNHTNGSEVILNTEDYLNGTMDGKVELADGTATTIFPNDTVVIKDGKNHSTYVGVPVAAGIKTEIDVELNMGDVGNALDGKTLTVVGGKTLTLGNASRNWAFGSVTMNGPGAVLVKGNVTATAIAGDATLKLAEGATLMVVETALAEGRVASGVDGMKVVFDSATKTYSLVLPPGGSITVEASSEEEARTKVPVSIPGALVTEATRDGNSGPWTVKAVLNKNGSVTFGEGESAEEITVVPVPASVASDGITVKTIPGLAYYVEVSTSEGFGSSAAHGAGASVVAESTRTKLTMPDLDDDAKVLFYRVVVTEPSESAQ